MDLPGGTLLCLLIAIGFGVIASIDEKPAVVPLRPVVEIFSTTAEQVLFALLPLRTHGPPVERFKVEYKPIATPAQMETLVVPANVITNTSQDSSFTFTRVRGLHENTKYLFNFYAISSVGESRGRELILSTPMASGHTNSSERPRFTTEPQTFHAELREQVIFFCKAEGQPRPTLTWEASDGNVLKRSLFDVIDFPGGSSLRFFAFSRFDGRGFTCVAKNEAGEVRASATLYVYEDEKELPEGYPVFLQGPFVKSTEILKTVSLDCQTPSDIVSTIYWLNNSVPVDVSDSRITQLDAEHGNVKKSTLTIAMAQESDQGVYECLAVNREGMALSTKGLLYVKARRVPSFFEHISDIFHVDYSGDINITCPARGAPTPLVQWHYNNLTAIHPSVCPELGAPTPLVHQHYSNLTAINPMAGMVDLPNVLQLRNVTESAVYTCIATSELGNIEKHVCVRVNPGEIESPPSHVMVRPVSPTSLAVEWELPEKTNGATIDGYRVFYTTEPDLPLVLWEFLEVGNENTTIRGLDPNRTYTISVLAYSNGQRGPLSDPVQVITRKEVIVPLQPRNLVAKAVGPTEIELNWDPPVNSDLVISYLLVYIDTSRNQSNQITVQAPTTKFKLTDLVPDTTYHITLAGTSKLGETSMATTVQARTLAFIPKSPKRVRAVAINATAISVQWRHKAASPVVGYHVHFAEINEDEDSETIEKVIDIQDPKVRWLIIGGLEPATRYSVAVSAFTRKGDGKRSKPAIASTKGLVAYTPLISTTMSSPVTKDSETAGCAQILAQDKTFQHCFIDYTVFLTITKGVVCSTDGQQKMACVLQYFRQCPEIMRQAVDGADMDMTFMALKQFLDMGCEALGGPSTTGTTAVTSSGITSGDTSENKDSETTGCAQVLAQDKTFQQCFIDYTVFLTITKGAVCSTDGEQKMACVLQYFRQCPEIMRQAVDGADMDMTFMALKKFLDMGCEVLGGPSTTGTTAMTASGITDGETGGITGKIESFWKTLDVFCSKTAACVQDSSFRRCFVDYTTFLQREMAKSQDMLGIICSTAGQQKMACVLQYVEQCPEMMEQATGGGWGDMDFTSFAKMGGLEVACEVLGGTSTGGHTDQNTAMNASGNTAVNASGSINGNIAVNASGIIGENTAVNASGNAGGNTAVNASGNIDGNKAVNTSGNIDGNTAVNASGNIGGNTAVNASGNIGGNTAVNASGNIGGNTAVNASGNIDGNKAVNTSGNIDGNTAVNASGNIGKNTAVNASGNIDGNKAVNTSGNIDGNTAVNASGNIGKNTAVNTSGNIDGNKAVNTSGNIGKNTAVNASGNIDGNKAVNTSGNIDGNKAVNASGNIDGNKAVNTSGNIDGNKAVNTSGNIDGNKAVNASGNIGKNTAVNASGNIDGNTAVNASGNINRNTAVNVSENTAPPTPVNVTAVRMLPFSILVNWDQPAADHGIAKYRIYYSPFIVPDMNLWETKDIDGEATVAHITHNIDRHTSYAVRVRAMSVNNLWSDYSDVVTSQSSNRELTGCAKVLALDSSFQQCIIDYTSLLHLEMAKYQDTLSIICSTEGQQKMGCLLKYATQCPEIMSTTGGGEMNFTSFAKMGGLKSACVVLGRGDSNGNTSDNTEFTYPRNISATAIDHGITVTWTARPNNLPTSAFYYVNYTSELQSGEFRVPSTSTNFTIGLLSGTTYRIHMSASLGGVEGEMSPAIVVKTRDIAYECDDRGVAGQSCSNLEKSFGSTKKMCKRAFHECCETCSGNKRICKRDKHVVVGGKVRDCNSLVQLFGRASACTLFTKECCVTCREEKFAIDSIETY